jgi:hypothetical protein
VRTAPLPLTLLLALVLTACGGGGSTPTDAAAGSSLASSEGGVPVEGDGDIGDGTTGGVPDTAPPFGVSSETDSTSLEPFTTCWSAAGSGACNDGVPGPTTPLAADDQLVVTYVEGQLTAKSSAPVAEQGVDPGPRSPLPAVQENPGIWLVDVSGLPTGQHTVWLTWTGEPGDASAAITLDVA